MSKYCPVCHSEYKDSDKFCSQCEDENGMPIRLGPKLASTRGIGVNLGDANAISGGVHLSDSHSVHNEDRSIHNITNTTSTVNNITNVAGQKSEVELLQERKTIYLNACKRAYEDNVLDQSEVVALEECRIKLGLDKETADAILDSVRVLSERNARKTELNPIARTKLKILTENLQKNEVKALLAQIDSLDSLVNRFNHEELTRKYYLALAALKSEKCIAQYEDTKTDSYWITFWSYLAYIKAGRISEADDVLASLDRFTSYPEDNMTVVATAGAIMMGDTPTAKELLSAITGDYTPALQRFVDSIYLLLDPETAKEMGAEEDVCTFYLVNFFGYNELKAVSDDIDELIALNSHLTASPSAEAIEYYRLGLEYYESDREPDAFTLFRKAATMGHLDSYFMLGQCLLTGKGIQQNREKGFEIIKNAANLNCANAQYRMARMYVYYRFHKDLGIEKDDSKVLEWYMKAAKQGHPDAQYWIGYYYETGENGLPKNIEEAKKWYRKAAEQGDKPAQEQLKKFQ